MTEIFVVLVNCTNYNNSIGSIRFRIGFREYLIGYLSYVRSSSPRYSVSTIVYLSLASCLVMIAFLTFILCLYLKLRNSKEKSCSTSPRTNMDSHEKVFWSTSTSAAAGPYYQVYEQIPSSSSLQNTLARTPLLVCPYHHQYQHYTHNYSTLSSRQHSQASFPFLSTLSVEHDRLKRLILLPSPE